MALKRWAWLWGPAVAALVLAIGLLPPSIPSGEGLLAMFGPADGGRAYYGSSPFRFSVDRALGVQGRRVDDMRLADSLVRAAAAAAAVRSADGLVTIVYERPLKRDSALWWLRAASAELATFPRAAVPGLPVVVALLADSARAGRGLRRFALYPTRVLTDAAASNGACVVAINLFSPRARAGWPKLVVRDGAGGPVGRFLDVCALYGRFGVPGAAVARWADRGPNWFWGGYDDLGMRLQEARRPIPRDTIATLVENSNPWMGAVPWLTLGCLRGTTPLCVRGAGLGVEPDGVSSPPYHPYYPFTLGQSLAFLLTRAPAARFEAFWRSARPPAEALEAAYAESAGSLVMSAYRHWFAAPATGGPRLGARVALAGLGWAVLALGLAIVAGRRWQGEP